MWAVVILGILISLVLGLVFIGVSSWVIRRFALTQTVLQLTIFTILMVCLACMVGTIFLIK